MQLLPVVPLIGEDDRSAPLVLDPNSFGVLVPLPLVLVPVVEVLSVLRPSRAAQTSSHLQTHLNCGSCMASSTCTQTASLPAGKSVLLLSKGCVNVQLIRGAAKAHS